MTYALINKLAAKPGQRDRVIEILLESMKLFGDNPACLYSIVHEAIADPNELWVADLWTSKEEHEAALQVPELRPFVEAAIPLLEGMPQQTELRPVGGKGLPPGS
jgi:quinol monooxygenase YgiN